MRVSLSITNTYVPEWRGNRDLPSEEQLKVVYRYMTAAQEEKYSEMYFRRGADGEMFETTVKTHAVEIWTDCVTAIEGMEDTDGKPITDPKQVLQVPGVYELVTEVVAIIKQGLTEEDSKN